MNVGDRVVFKGDLVARLETARCGTVVDGGRLGYLFVEYDHLPGFKAVQHPTWLELLRSSEESS